MECAFLAAFLPLSNKIRQYDYNLSPLIIKEKMEQQLFLMAIRWLPF